MANWQVHQAKSKLSELMDLAKSDGPQIITKHGKPEVVVLSMRDYAATRRDKPDFVEFLLNGPKFDDLDLERNMDVGREIDLD